MHSNRPISRNWQLGCFSHRIPEGGMAHISQSDGITETADRTILVVEDGEAVRKMICAMLSQHGYHCLEAADGHEALVVLNGIRKINLVLTDLMMPGMGGAELAR